MLLVELVDTITPAGGSGFAIGLPPPPSELLLPKPLSLLPPPSPLLSDEQAENTNAKAMEIAAERKRLVVFMMKLLVEILQILYILANSGSDRSVGMKNL
jgi:hypothetical protein